MKILTLVINDDKRVDKLLKALYDAGIEGGTMLDSTGMHHTMLDRDDEMQTHYGILRSYLKRSRAHSKTLFFVEEEKTIAKIEQIITDTLGDLNEPDIGFMFIQDVVRMVGGSKAKKN